MAGIMFERKERRKNIFLHSLADHPTKGKTDDAVIKYIDNSRRCIVEWDFAYFSRRDYLIYQLTLTRPGDVSLRYTRFREIDTRVTEGALLFLLFSSPFHRVSKSPGSPECGIAMLPWPTARNRVEAPTFCLPPIFCIE